MQFSDENEQAMIITDKTRAQGVARSLAVFWYGRTQLLDTSSSKPQVVELDLHLGLTEVPSQAAA